MPGLVKEKSFGQVLLTALKKLVLKLVSIKNLFAIAAVVLGVIVIDKPHIQSQFNDWANYMIKLGAMFFGSNQLQKWIFGRYGIKDTRDEDLYDGTPDPGGPGHEDDN